MFQQPVNIQVSVGIPGAYSPVYVKLDANTTIADFRQQVLNDIQRRVRTSSVRQRVLTSFNGTTQITSIMRNNQNIMPTLNQGVMNRIQIAFPDWQDVPISAYLNLNGLRQNDCFILG